MERETLFTRYPTAEEELQVRREQRLAELAMQQAEEQARASALANELRKLQIEQAQQQIEHQREMQNYVSDLIRRMSGIPGARGEDIGMFQGRWVGVRPGAEVRPFEQIPTPTMPTEDELTKMFQRAALRKAGFDIPYQLPSEIEERALKTQAAIRERELAKIEEKEKRAAEREEAKAKEQYKKELVRLRASELKDAEQRYSDEVKTLKREHDKWLLSVAPTGKPSPQQLAFYQQQLRQALDDAEQRYRERIRRINKYYAQLSDLPLPIEEETPTRPKEEMSDEELKSAVKQLPPEKLKAFKRMYKAQTGKDWED